MPIPVLPPAAQDKEVLITIPAKLAPYMELIHSMVAPELTEEEYLSGFLVSEGEIYLRNFAATEAVSDMRAGIDGAEETIKVLLEK